MLFAFSSESFSQTCPSCTVDESVHTNTGPEVAGLVPDEFTVQAGEDTTFTAQYIFPTSLSVSGFNATVTSVQILGIVGLPPNTNLTWVCDQPGTNCTYSPQSYRYGCVQLCIFTLAPAGTYIINVQVNGCGSAAGISQCQIENIPITINVLPPAGNPFFTASATIGCDSLTVDFEETVPPLGVIFPQSFEWDLGTGSNISGPTATNTFVGEGEYEVTLIETVEEFYISAASLTATNTDCFCGDVEEPNWPLIGCTASPEPYLIINAGGTDVTLGDNSGDNSNTSSWSNIDIPLQQPAISIQAWEEDALSADDNLGSTLVTFSNTPQTGTFNFSTSFGGNNCANGTYTLSRRVKEVQTYVDTITIAAPSVEPIITNLGVDVICEGDSTVLESTLSGSYQWFLNDTTTITGQTNQTLTVFEAGSYSVRVTDDGTICSALSQNYEIEVEDVTTPIIDFNPSTNVLSINNPDGYDVQWFTNATGSPIPIPGGTNNELSNISLTNSPFTVRFTSALGCSALSAPFEICVPGSATSNGTELDLSTPIVFTHDDFVLITGNTVAWAVSTSTDGPIENMTSLQAAIDAGWVLPGTSSTDLNLSCGNLPSGINSGNYYMTPFTAEISTTEPFIFDTLENCIPDANLCIEISGSDFAILANSLTFTLPNGQSIGVIATLIPPDFPVALPDTLTPDLLGLLPSFLPEGLCFQLTDLYDGDINGTWSLSAENVGTGPVNVELFPIEILVDADSCGLISEDQFGIVPGQSSSISAGSSNTISFIVPPTPEDFPSIQSNCNVFGEAVAFTINCPTSINDIEFARNFNLYPNPNNGVFNIVFDVLERSDVTLQIYDVMGRNIMHRTYEPMQGKFNEKIELKNNLSAGFYIFNVKVGSTNLQKHFIIE